MDVGAWKERTLQYNDPQNQKNGHGKSNHPWFSYPEMEFLNFIVNRIFK